MSAAAFLHDPEFLFALVLFGCGLVASGVLTALARRYALHQQLLDHPGQRRSHTASMPRGGGIGPVVVLLAGGSVLMTLDPQSRQSLGTCLIGLIAVAGIGWFDDHRPLPAWLRLAVHLGSALAVSVALMGMPQTAMQIGVIAASTVVLAGLVNTWNFMDGIDGLATSQAALVALFALLGGWLDGAWSHFALLLFAATLGFLPFNTPRARIFLGDVGSGALGFAIACLLLRAIASGAMPWPLAAVMVSAFLIDAGMTLLLRIVRGKAWWRPHREHLYQWMVRGRYTHAQVARWYALWTLTAGALAIGSKRCGPAFLNALSVSTLLCGCFVWMWLRNRLWIAAQHRR